MKMTPLEKLLVNRQAKSLGNVRQLDATLASMDVSGFRDVLEIGCGTGVVCAHLCVEHWMNVTGIDVDADQIGIARERFGEHASLRFEVADAARLPRPDASFDLVVAQNAFHHITGWQHALAEVARVLRPGGAFIWHDFALTPWLRRFLRPLNQYVGVYTLADVRGTLAHAGVFQRRHQRRLAGPIERHLLVLEKLRSWPAPLAAGVA